MGLLSQPSGAPPPDSPTPSPLRGTPAEGQGCFRRRERGKRVGVELPPLCGVGTRPVCAGAGQGGERRPGGWGLSGRKEEAG